MYLVIVFVVVNGVYLANSQMGTNPIKPEKCYGEDRIMDLQCCIFPPFFKRDVARSCGARFAFVDLNTEHNVTKLRRENSYHDCSYWKCLLTKYGMLDSADRLIVDKYFSHLDKWMALNPEFNPVLLNAKMYCRESQRFYFPLTTCEFFNFNMCIRGYVNVHCPSIIQTKECLEWKEFYEDCKEYYI